MKLYLALLSLLSLATSVCAQDTHFEKQWGLINKGQTILRAEDDLTKEEVTGIAGVDINWVRPESLKNIPSDREIVVAVIDSGLDVTHPDLKNRIWVDKKRCADEIKIDCHGYNALEGNGNVADDTGHGTHISGIIAANANSIGIQGLAHKQVKIMPIKVLSKETTSFVYNNKVMTDIIADGIRYALENGADVINMSLGWPGILETPKIKRSIEVAIDRNVPIVVAAGNNNKEIPTYPCTSKGVICVGAHDNRGIVTEFSNFGGKVDILAPGEFIVSTYPTKGVESRLLRTHGYEAKKGSSQASPFVAGVAATLKLINPEISLDELKTRIFKTAKKQTSGKKSKYGMIDMKAAIDFAGNSYISPVFKDLLDITLSDDQTNFYFSLPIKNFLKDEEKVKVLVESIDGKIQFKQSEFSINGIKKGKVDQLLVMGSLNSLQDDNNSSIKVTIFVDEQIVDESETVLMFARNLEKVSGSEIIKLPFTDVDPKLISYIKGNRKTVKIKQISDPHRLDSYVSYFILDPRKQADGKTILTVFDIKEKIEQKDIVLESNRNILAIFKNDTNLDGQSDYFVYSLNEDKTQLVFDLLTTDGKKLFSQSEWFFPITEFEGLPLKQGFLENFEWVKISHDKFGKILVPLIYKNHFLPEKDNSRSILDRVPSESVAWHYYYLNPVAKEGKVEIELRVLDSVSFVTDLQEEFDLGDWESLSFEKNYPQSKFERASGKNSFIVSVGDEFLRRYFEVTFTDIKKWTAKELFSPNYFLSSNNPITVKDKNGEVTSQRGFLAIEQRNEGRLLTINSSSKKNINFSTGDWSDPVFNSIAGFESDEAALYLESRYFVHVFNNSGQKYSLPINRDSAFPGVNFSETINSVLVSSDEQIRTGVFINSTLIFGNRLYTMVKTESDFIRPVKLSVAIPDYCIPMDPINYQGEDSMLLLCRDSARGASLWVYPLRM